MMATIINSETENRLSFVTFIIEKFASSFKMDRQEAYFYLKKHGGLDYIFDCWQDLHVDNPYWAVRDIYKVCLKNGGTR